MNCSSFFSHRKTTTGKGSKAIVVELLEAQLIDETHRLANPTNAGKIDNYLRQVNRDAKNNQYASIEVHCVFTCHVPTSHPTKHIHYLAKPMCYPTSTRRYPTSTIRYPTIPMVQKSPDESYRLPDKSHMVPDEYFTLPDDSHGEKVTRQVRNGTRRILSVTRRSPFDTRPKTPAVVT